MNKGIEYLKLLWSDQWKTKYGLVLASILLAFVSSGSTITILKLLNVKEKTFLIVLCALLMPQLLHLLVWYFCSGRIFITNSKFTVVFCLAGKDLQSEGKSDSYIQNAISILKGELEKLGLLEKINLKSIGQDIIKTKEDALDYREKYDIDLIIWGKVYSGSKEKQEVCDFKKIFFTCKMPSYMLQANLSDLFKKDINIALVGRDWNIYEVNSLPDIEKISGHLNEVIMYILGIIYCQYYEYAEDSAIILEGCIPNLL
ncbi:MAG: hypothetical protein MRK01_04675 [Candidatus Scalindua sp.]|nr:hypothetical protein [Candidatus Scalindua sp.]